MPALAVDLAQSRQSSSWRRADMQTQVREDLLDEGPIQDGADDLQIAAKLPVLSDGNWP